MAGNSESNDASDIFWPGYVDAISNLAINLLFVIAVMCIVILSFVLEETTKGKPQEGDAPVVSESISDKTSKTSAEDMKALQQENAKLKQELKTLQSASNNASPKDSTSASASGTPNRSNVTNTTPKMDVVNARQEVMKDEKGQSNMSAVGAGLIVNFDPKVVTLSPEEGKEVITRLEAYGPPKSTRWQITVITPKGLSESARLGYYRAVAVRNVLIQNGVPGELINMRVLESAQAAADSARVTVSPSP